MRISFVIPPVWATYTPSLGIASLIGSLRPLGHECKVFDYNLISWHLLKNVRIDGNDLWDMQNYLYFYEDELFDSTVLPLLRESLDTLVDQICADKPDVIGFSMYYLSFPCARVIAKECKARLPNTKIVYGGSSINVADLNSVHAEFDRSPIDVAVIGEGEATLVELLDRWSKGQSLRGCLGISHRPEGQAVVNEPMRGPVDFPNLPTPCYELFDHSLYTDKKNLPVMISRGCVAKCTFCAETRFWPRFRFRSAKQVFQEILRLQETYGAETIQFNDSLINGNFQVLEELLDLLIGMEKKIKWLSYARIDKRMTPELLERMARSGCVYLKYGFESGSQRIVDLMEKRATVEVAREVIRNTHRVGIDAKIMVIVGFPGETEDDFRLTMDFLEENKEFIHAVYPSELMVLPGLPIAVDPRRYGISTEKPLMGKAWESTDGLNTPAVRRQRLMHPQEFIRGNIRESIAHWPEMEKAPAVELAKPSYSELMQH